MNDQQVQTLVPNDNWLGDSLSASNMLMTQTNASGSSGNMQCAPSYGQNINCYPWTGQYYYPWTGQYYYPVYYTSTARPIKLLLSEVECLRKAAKSDAKLKAILQKFTEQIEITVDFS